MSATTWESLGIDVPPGAIGPEVAAVCPKCSADRKKRNVKCMSVNVEIGAAVCHHCGWSCGLNGSQESLPPAWRRPKYKQPREVAKSPLPAWAMGWLATRRIPDALAVEAGVTVDSVYMPQLEDFSPALVFPYVRDGVTVNHKYRAKGKKFRMDAGAERIFYNLDSINESQVIICEGEVDCLSLKVAGFDSCVSVPDGAPAVNAKDYSSKFEFLEADEGRLAGVKQFVLAVDNDEPGKLLEEELARRLGRERCLQVAWPEGCKDANDVLVLHGIERLREVIDGAIEYPIEGIITVDSQMDAIKALYKNGLDRGASTGWASVDEYFTVRPGELTVIIGTPSSGKSNWVDALTMNLANLHGWTFGMFSPENQPVYDHMARMVEKFTELPFREGRTQRMDETELEVGASWVREHFFWLLPKNEESWNIAWILEQAKLMVRRKGIRGLIIDPWNELESERGGDRTETEYVSRTLRTVRQFAREYCVHVFLVVHPTKMYRDKNGKYPIPNLYDASGSANFRNKADNGICIWRDFDNPDNSNVDIIVQKIRFRQVGRLGKVSLEYQPATATYKEVARLPRFYPGGAAYNPGAVDDD